MTLEEIFELCKSNDYKERTRGEYYFVKDKYNKLHAMIIRREAGKIDFTPNCPIEQWEAQEKAMGEYLHQLVIKANIENIQL